MNIFYPFLMQGSPIRFGNRGKYMRDKDDCWKMISPMMMFAMFGYHSYDRNKIMHLYYNDNGDYDETGQDYR